MMEQRGRIWMSVLQALNTKKFKNDIRATWKNINEILNRRQDFIVNIIVWHTANLDLSAE